MNTGCDGHCWSSKLAVSAPFAHRFSPWYSGLGLSLLFPKHYLIFYSEFPELLPYYSLRIDLLFLKIGV